MIAIVDYGLGNLHSVRSALEFMEIPSRVTRDVEALASADRMILPGVGSFRVAMENIRRFGLYDPIRAFASTGKPVLGICLGMQLLASSGDEDGPTPGLDLIKGRVEHFPALTSPLRVPHIGFNSVAFVPGTRSLFTNLDLEADFYFVHSYRFVCDDVNDVAGWCSYGERFAAVIERGNIMGTQFHPEKSQANGLKLLANFAKRAA